MPRGSETWDTTHIRARHIRTREKGGIGMDPVMPAHILVVEDDPAIGEILVTLLEEEGHRVERARDGIEALDRFDVAADRPAVVLIDFMLPRLDGPGFVRELEARGLRGETQVVVVSGGVNAEEWAREIRAAALVAKPFELDAVIAAVDSALRVSA